MTESARQYIREDGCPKRHLDESVRWSNCENTMDKDELIGALRELDEEPSIMHQLERLRPDRGQKIHYFMLEQGWKLN